MKRYVISLDTATERRCHITQEFAKHALSFEFFNAITPLHVDEWARRFDINLHLSKRLSAGEKACLLSHLGVWQRCLDDNLDYVAVFEDDVCLGENAWAFMHDDWLTPICFDVIKLETFFEKVHSKTVMHHHNRQIERLYSPHLGAAAYIISRQGIIKIMQYIASTPPKQLPAFDHILFEYHLKQLTIYQINPALCVQQMFYDKAQLPSQLESQRLANAHHSRIDDTPRQQFTRLIARIKRSIGKRTFYKVIDFQ